MHFGQSRKIESAQQIHMRPRVPKNPLLRLPRPQIVDSTKVVNNYFKMDLVYTRKQTTHRQPSQQRQRSQVS